MSTSRRVVDALGLRSTAFRYVYTDAHGGMGFAEVLFRGTPQCGTGAAMEQMIAASRNGKRFIPEQVGLRPLQPLVTESYRSRRDGEGYLHHEWHELDNDHSGIPFLEASMGNPGLTQPVAYAHADDFVAAFCAQSWDERSSRLYQLRHRCVAGESGLAFSSPQSTPSFVLTYYSPIE